MQCQVPCRENREEESDRRIGDACFPAGQGTLTPCDFERGTVLCPSVILV